MMIPSPNYLKSKARNRLKDGQEPQKVVLVYSAIVAGMTLVTTFIRYFLSTQISQTGGLSNLGSRAILSTIDNVLPVVQSIITLCLLLGYTAAMLRISRRQYASPKTLKAGAERFFPLMISRLLQGLIYAGLGFAAFYASLGLFLLSPFSDSFMERATALINVGEITPEVLLADEALLSSLMQGMTPMFIIYALIYIPLIVSFSYRYRLTDYILIDQPGCSAANAMRQSRRLMMGNKLLLFKVDLSFWWYYSLRVLTAFLLYLDVILPLLGVSLPNSEFLQLAVVSILYLGADFAVNYYCMNYFKVTEALAYNSLIPKEESTGVVLGNIFQM